MEQIVDKDSFAKVFGAICTDVAESRGGPVDSVLPVPVPSLTWDEYVGQAMVKQQLLVRIHSAKTRGKPMPHVLLVAEGGSGKTTIAELIAAELGKPLIEINRPPKNNDELIDRIWQLSYGEGGVLFVDEVHLWPPGRAQHALMSLTESQMIDSDRGPVRFPGVTVIAATTDPQKLTKPLRSRFACKPTFLPYTVEEISSIIERLLRLEDIEISAEELTMLAEAAGGNPRQARHLFEATRDLHVTGLPHNAATVLAFCDIEPDGLTRDHMAYLNVLAACRHGRAGKESLSDMLGIATSEVRQLERLLSLRGLVALGGSSGRQITPAGRLRVSG